MSDLLGALLLSEERGSLGTKVCCTLEERIAMCRTERPELELLTNRAHCLCDLTETPRSFDTPRQRCSFRARLRQLVVKEFDRLEQPFRVDSRRPRKDGKRGRSLRPKEPIAASRSAIAPGECEGI